MELETNFDGINFDFNIMSVGQAINVDYDCLFKLRNLSASMV